MNCGKALSQIKETKCEFVAAFYLFFPYLVTVFNGVIRTFVETTRKLDTAFLYGLLLLLILLSIRQILSRIGPWPVVFFLALMACVLISMFFSPNTDINISVATDILTSCLPPFLLLSTVRDFAALKKYLTVAAEITPYLVAFIFFFLKLGRIGSSSYDQSLSYFLLFPAIVLLSGITEKFGVKLLIPLIISLFTMLSYGARGPIMCVLLFAAIIFLFRFPSAKLQNKILMITAFTVTAVLVYLNYYAILQSLLDLLSKAGLSTRTVQRLISRSFFEDSSRLEIYRTCIDRILDNPVVGTGMVNDRIFLSRSFGLGRGSLGYYPHNFFLEVLLQFGLVLGSILLIWLGYVLVRCLCANVPQDAKRVVLIFIGTGMLPLLFSGSYVNSPDFYVLLAVCGVILLTQRHEQRKLNVYVKRVGYR